MNLFIKAKHWQIFIITICIPYLFKNYLFDYMIIPNEPFEASLKFIAVTFLHTFGLWFWFWASGIELQKSLPNKNRLKIWKFKTSYFSLLFLLGSTFIATTYMIDGDVGLTEVEGSDHLLLGGVIDLHLLVISLSLTVKILLFYCIYFIAKTIQNGTEKPKKGGTFLNFLWITFYPLGIWFIQPKINRLVQEKFTPLNSNNENIETISSEVLK